MKIDVLDHGYVRYVDSMGGDISVVNAARVSYDKEVEELTEKDIGLINFLLRYQHTSPFRHAVMSYEVYAPLLVARQWWKYCVASTHTEDQQGWNESSRRYITEEPVFYVPEPSKWRSIPENRKQGSGPNLNISVGHPLTSRVTKHFDDCLALYDELVNELDVAPEQARLVLPAYALYVRWRWTISLQGALHFLNQRMAGDAQKEIRQYAKAVMDITRPIFEHSIDAWDIDG